MDTITKADLYTIIKLLPFEKKLFRLPIALQKGDSFKNIFIKVKKNKI
jgi:hypothetical protein